MKQRTITLHKLVRLKFEQCKTVVGGINHKWQSDLCNSQNLQADNGSYKYLPVNIDAFSKFAIASPLKNKNATTVKAAYETSI